jgi:hypothetical protein
LVGRRRSHVPLSTAARAAMLFRRGRCCHARGTQAPAPDCRLAALGKIILATEATARQPPPTRSRVHALPTFHPQGTEQVRLMIKWMFETLVPRAIIRGTGWSTSSQCRRQSSRPICFLQLTMELEAVTLPVLDTDDVSLAVCVAVSDALAVTDELCSGLEAGRTGKFGRASCAQRGETAATKSACLPHLRLCRGAGNARRGRQRARGGDRGGCGLHETGRRVEGSRASKSVQTVTQAPPHTLSKYTGMLHGRAYRARRSKSPR